MPRTSLLETRTLFPDDIDGQMEELAKESYTGCTKHRIPGRNNDEWWYVWESGEIVGGGESFDKAIARASAPWPAIV